MKNCSNLISFVERLLSWLMWPVIVVSDAIVALFVRAMTWFKICPTKMFSRCCRFVAMVLGKTTGYAPFDCIYLMAGLVRRLWKYDGNNNSTLLTKTPLLQLMQTLSSKLTGHQPCHTIKNEKYSSMRNSPWTKNIGYTESHYRGLVKLYDRFKDSTIGFNILAFPCNQFGEQE